MPETAPYKLKDFKQDVLEQSVHIPVLVNYWTSWCEPCKFLEPIIEKLASESLDKWKLVKINTEEHSDIAAEWGIRGIPNLKLFYKGKVIADLAGAMAETEMRNWLEDKLPSEAKGMAMEASEYIANGNTKKGIKLLERAILLDSTLTEAKVLLAKIMVWTKPNEVASLVQEIKHVQEAEELLLLAEFLESDFVDFEDGKTRRLLKEVQELLIKKMIEPSIELLIKSIIIDKTYHNELARRLIIAIFHTLGEKSDITKNYRKRFDVALY
ncbi:MAG: tetratricopeptide repeat protein [Cyclobacteriaceae bacterium]|nr:tetratricopeptide repeat protein [Cyclobacteriaceae bacterium]